MKRNIHISVIICTYKRKEALEANLARFRGSRFFNEADELYGKLSIRIIDNASELMEVKERYIKLYHNPNTGGSGGFTRGIIETRKDEKEYGITHVVFMDDDVECQMESFYRLYALLVLCKEEYQNSMIAGRMFRMDAKNIQYTAAEVWNAGDIRHIGCNLDMTRQENLSSANDNTGAEYGGWWFACFPMNFVREQTPLPFFLHCDDVEYGLRHGGTPIILNGIQVWHETYEYRQSPAIAYYDTRNPLIVNAMYGLLPEKEVVLAEWKRKISECHVRGDYLTEYMIILGMWDFLKGTKWIKKINVEKNHHNISRKRYFLRFTNALFWRMVVVRYKRLKGEVVRKNENSLS